MKRFLTVLFLLFVHFICAAQDIFVFDADTFRYGNRKIRLYGIDAPERGTSQLEEQGYQYVKRLLKTSKINLKHISFDRYGREVCIVYINGEDLSLKLVREGWAVVYRKYCNNPSYYAAEKEAKTRKLNIWK